MSRRPLQAALAVALAVGTVACGPATGSSQTPQTPDPLAGRYTISGGGGAFEPLNALKAAFLKAHPAVTFVVEDVGSDAGVALTASGLVDLGTISRDLRDGEKDKVATLPIGVSGTAIAVNAVNPVTGLTKDQVRDIYAGTINDWAAVGGTPGKITKLLREANSATRSAFESYFFNGKATYEPNVIEVYEIDETIKSIRSFKDAIGMVTATNRATTDQTIRLLAIDGVLPTSANLQNGTYKIRRPLYLVYTAAGQKPAIKAFLDFVRSPEGQRIISEL